MRVEVVLATAQVWRSENIMQELIPSLLCGHQGVTTRYWFGYKFLLVGPTVFKAKLSNLVQFKDMLI